VIAAAALAQQRGLSIVSGYCYRYDRAMTETVRQIQSGAIGEIRSIYCAYNKGAWDLLPRQPQWSEMEFQVRNYRHYVWLQGDIILELSHNIDKISWILGEYPVRAWGMGGRQSDNTSACFDHHAVVYEYASGLRLTSYNRAVQGADFENADVLYGTQGAASLMDYEITGARPWIYSGPRNDMYQTQLDTLVAAIRAGRPVNDGEWMAKSTFMGILGRWASYTGRKIEWTRAWNSTQVLGPPAYSWGPAPAERIAIPGRTRLT
jgi:predicted dehydrogenase